MPKKYSTSTTLVIVESPAKCKKIEEYLGPGYKCIASYGHLREINSLKNIDIDNHFTPVYNIINNNIKIKQIEILRKEINAAAEIILATDGDREGEAIAWHICDLFKLDINKTKRIIFNEITEPAIKKAIENPQRIDMNLFEAQKARQILDILVGFKVSPILWKLISSPKGKDNALSAGRCQTPALKLIYDNQQEIAQANEQKLYDITGYFTNLNIAFNLNSQDKYETEIDITHFLNGTKDFCHTYTCSSPITKIKYPPHPFNTSRIQQVASNELHLSPKETMSVCQQLYESGYITYMRTDTQLYSDKFLDSVKEFIVKTYNEGEKYINENIDLLCLNIRKNTDKKENCQEAHEAIRPTNISLCELPETIGSKERRLYKLIWENTLESCMSNATYNSITASITAFQNNKFTYTSELNLFPGWKIVSKNFTRENKEYQYLQQIKQDTIISYKKIVAKSIIKGIKQHFTEAKLVQKLEEKGIGRPSTFASIIEKIKERGYVKKEDVKGKEIICKDFELQDKTIIEIDNQREFGNEKNKLVIQPLGLIVTDFLYQHFSLLFNYDYTKNMEDKLDKISQGTLHFYELCQECNTHIDTLLDKLKDEKKMEIKIDENNTFIIGKYGPVIKHIEKEGITFLPIKKDIDITTLREANCNLSDILDTEKIADADTDIDKDKDTSRNKKEKNGKNQHILGEYKGDNVILKKGKFGIYVEWGNISKTLKQFGNRPIENIQMDEIIKYLEETNIVREISENISIRKSKKGDYLFFKTKKMKKPTFFDITHFSQTKEDYKICDINILKSWIIEKYNIN